jgi:hypothetical protein
MTTLPAATRTPGHPAHQLRLFGVTARNQETGTRIVHVLAQTGRDAVLRAGVVLAGHDADPGAWTIAGTQDPAADLPAPGKIRFQAVNTGSRELAHTTEWDQADAGALRAYVMRWTSGRHQPRQVVLTYPDGTVKIYPRGA